MTARAALTALEWPPEQVPDALRALSAGSGYAIRPLLSPATDAGPNHPGALTRSVAETVARWVDGVGLDAEPVDIPARAPVETLRGLAPVLVRAPGGRGLLAVLRIGRTHATLLGPKGRVDAPTSLLDEAFDDVFDDAFTPALAGTDATARTSSVLRAVESIAPERRGLAVRVLLAPTRALASRPATEAWSLRPGATGIGDTLRDAKLRRRIATVVAGYVVQFALFLAIWQQVAGRGVDRAGHGAGAYGPGHAWPWFMALLTLWVVVQVAASAAVSRLALDIGAIVRAGLMRGALRLDPERIRSAGVGQLLGRALDAEALDALALGGGVEAAAGLFEMALGGGVMAMGTTPMCSLGLLGVGASAFCALGWTHARRLSSWGHTRRALTHDLVERMVGHRTVLIQDRPARRARADDASLGAYDSDTRALDHADVGLAVVIPRLWLLAGLLVLAPSVFSSGGNLGASLALSLGGLWLVFGAFRRLGVALPMLALARDAWGRISPLVGTVEAGVAPASGAVASRQASEAGASGARGAGQEPNATVADVNPGNDGPPGYRPGHFPPMLVADKVSYQYPGRESAVLNGVTLVVEDGDRVLVKGASGGGKSTLAALLTGLKAPTSGHLRLRGVDQRTIGLGRWRGAIGGAPQFHENHLFGADLLFNLLMGRRWPPRLEDLEAAERVCRELGLGPLLDRMPAGLQQQIGETGWQLSHGERSRVFIARSLLQPLAARVLDESFAALDPATVDQVMAAVLARPEALIVIAHP